MTIRPEFFGTGPNFEGLSRKNTRSFGTLNCPEFRIMSRICRDLTSRCVKRQAAGQNAVDRFDVFACQRCILLSSKRAKSIFGRGSAPDHAGGAYDAPSDLLVGWGEGLYPYVTPLTPLGSRTRHLEKCPEFLSQVYDHLTNNSHKICCCVSGNMQSTSRKTDQK